MKNQPRRIFFGCLAILIVSLMLARHRLVFMVHQYQGNFEQLSLHESPYLRDVAEPITIIKGTIRAGSDDHWMGLTFQDSKQVERHARYVFYLPGISHTLTLGNNRASVRDECVFLGLLLRWSKQHPELHELRERAKQRDPLTLASPLDTGEFTDEQIGKLVAGSMGRVLLRTN